MSDVANFLHLHSHGLAISVVVFLLGLVATIFMRSVTVAGGSGMVIASRIAIGWWRYSQGDARDVVNVTLNTTRGDVLSIDTMVGDTHLADVWSNPYFVQKVLSATKRCTMEDPVIRFSEKEGTNGDTRKREQAYRALYDPLVRMTAERVSNNGSIDLSLGKDVVSHRFVLGLTYEPILEGRQRHLRVMMILEEEIADILDESRAIEFWKPQHATRLRSLRAVARAWRERPNEMGFMYVWRPR